MADKSGSKTQPEPASNPKVMELLRLWHSRMAHANLRAVVVLARRGDLGEIPDGMPKGPEDNFEGLQPYLDELNCEACKESDRSWILPFGPEQHRDQWGPLAKVLTVYTTPQSKYIYRLNTPTSVPKPLQQPTSEDQLVSAASLCDNIAK
ncbi:hypothetical protein F5Y18DRAFT_421531 [Xylariaceae sp. FL1019]|nr:hypothetical protein F5Y18DRAFT_421531 [Xylariaceae sp. FL1019]